MDDYTFNLGGSGEEDEQEQWEFGGRSATVYLVDAAPPMLAARSDQDTPNHLSTALKCIHASVSRHIISSDHDLTAVVLFNTGGDSAAHNRAQGVAFSFKHVSVMQGLARPSAERVMELETLLEGDSSLLEEKFGGSCEGASLSEALWTASYIISQCKQKLWQQNVMLFTCRDQPHSDPQLRRQALTKARDLSDAGMHLELIALGDGFDTGAFYKEMLTLGGEQPDKAPTVCSERLENLMERVRRVEHRVRTTGRLLMKLGPDVEMSVCLYTAVRKTSKPQKQRLCKRTNEEVRTVTKEFNEQTGELLMPSDFVKYQNVRGKKIVFTHDEVRSTAVVHPVGIELLGFKPLSFLTPDLYVRPAHFLRPSEEDVKGSTALFTALLQRCSARSVLPIVRVVPRVSSEPAWAALLPQQGEEDEETGEQITPAGFHVCYLPFADDFRDVDLSSDVRASGEMVDAAKAIVNKLSFRFDPLSFDNPDLQTHWRNVECLALNRTELEPVPDYTAPNNARIRKRAGPLIDAFKTAVFPPGYDPEAVMAAKPRPPQAQGRSYTVKAAAPKTVEEAVAAGTVERLTVAVLRAWLEARGVTTAGKKKPQLVCDVYDA